MDKNPIQGHRDLNTSNYISSSKYPWSEKTINILFVEQGGKKCGWKFYNWQVFFIEGNQQVF